VGREHFSASRRESKRELTQARRSGCLRGHGVGGEGGGEGLCQQKQRTKRRVEGGESSGQ